MTLEIRILGPVQLCRDGRPQPLTAARSQAMLAALALEANRPVPLRRLTEALWADRPPDSATANLRSHALRLRRLLPRHDGTSRLTSTPGGYQLHLEPGELDSDRFHAHLRRGHTAADAGDHHAASHHLAHALRLWRGEAGDGLPTGTALQRRMTTLNTTRLTAFEDYAEARLHLGQHRAMIEALYEHTSRYPLRERGWRHLMLALYRTGELAAAIGAYRQACDILHQQLDVAPGPELVTLYQAIKVRDPQLAAPVTRPDRQPIIAS